MESPRMRPVAKIRFGLADPYKRLSFSKELIYDTSTADRKPCCSMFRRGGTLLLSISKKKHEKLRV